MQQVFEKRISNYFKIVLALHTSFPYSTFSLQGGVAQLGERLTGSQEVRGSIPLVSTMRFKARVYALAFLFSFYSVRSVEFRCVLSVDVPNI